MITTKDVLRTHDEIHTVWELGMHENAMSKNEIIKANIQEITNNIISKREGFVFRLSGVLLCGIARLYSKKSHFFLIDCEEAIARISLRFEPIDKKKKKNGKSKNNIEIDEETMRLWQGGSNLESIIEQEQRDDNSNIQAEIILSSSEANTSPNINTKMIIDNDFGNVPFEISTCTFDDSFNTLNFSDNLNAEDNDIIPAPYENDDINNADLDSIENESQTKNMKKNWYIIDPTPVIPLTQLSIILEDTSKTLCQRPINKTRINTMPFKKIVDRDDLINEIKKIVEKIPVFNGEDIYNDDVVVDLPPPMSDDQNEIAYFDSFDTNDNQQRLFEISKENSIVEPEQSQKIFSTDMINNLKIALENKKEEELQNMVSSHSRKSLALSFFTALSLKNRGIVEITQSSEKSISLSKGPNFHSFLLK